MSERLPMAQKKCIPCEGGATALSERQIEGLLPRVNGWLVKETTVEGKRVQTIQKRLEFRDFRQAMKFLREVEEIAEAEGHHPDFCVHYSKVDFTIWTHAINGLHENDFVLAAKIDELEEQMK